jgi:biopolymer transport protein ExbB/TolQ
MKKLNIFFLALGISFFVFEASANNVSEKPLNKKIEQSSKDEIALGDSLLNIKQSLIKENNSHLIAPPKKGGSMNLKEVFFGAPIIYSILLAMSITSFVILVYTLLTFRRKDLMTRGTVEDIKNYLLNDNYQDALNYCEQKKNLLSIMLASGICSRGHGAQFMIDSIKAEGRRATEKFWHRISLLNDIVVIAPMLGLLGTVIGMFYAFYDINRSIDTLSALFDGLGIAVGTTVAGLIVAILAMIFYSILKFKMIKSLSLVENEAVSLGNLIKTKD